MQYMKKVTEVPTLVGSTGSANISFESLLHYHYHHHQEDGHNRNNSLMRIKISFDESLNLSTQMELGL